MSELRADKRSQRIAVAVAIGAILLGAAGFSVWYFYFAPASKTFQIAENRPADVPSAPSVFPQVADATAQATTKPAESSVYKGILPNQPRDPLTVLRHCKDRDPAVEEWVSQWQARAILATTTQSNSSNTDSLRQTLSQTRLPAEALLEVGLAMDKLDDHYAAAFFAEQGVNKVATEFDALAAQGIKPGDPQAQRLCDALQVADETLWRVRGIPNEGVATLLKGAHLRAKWLTPDDPRMGWARLSEISWAKWPPGGMLAAVEKIDADIARHALTVEGNQVLELKWMRAMALADAGRYEEAATWYDDLVQHPTAWHQPQIKRMYALCLARLNRENDALRMMLGYIDDTKLSDQAAYDAIREVQKILEQVRSKATSQPGGA